LTLLYSQTKAISLPDSNGWIRPYDWLQIPALVPGSQVCYLLNAVFPVADNFMAVWAVGDYTVNWGDGTFENVASGTTAFKNYNFNNLPASTATSEGYRQALITITPQAGQDLTQVNLSLPYNQSGGYSTGLLEIAINSPNLNTFFLNGNASNSPRHRYLQKCTVAENIVSNWTRTFLLSNSIESVIVNLNSATTMEGFFQSALPIKRVRLNIPNTVTNFANCFNSATSLKEITNLNLAGASSSVSLTNSFSNLRSLSRLQVTGVRVSFSVANCALSRSAIIELFEGLGLSTETPTINISGNYGAASLTTDERNIAINKGWKITG
jgi:hypothetical protein